MREQPGPVHHRGAGPELSGWLDPRRRGLGGRAFALHRISGVILLFYLYLHLAVLSLLLVGASAWGSFLGIVTSHGFLAMEVLLILGLIFHGLNGLRVALVGSGLLVTRQRRLFWTGSALAAATIAFTALDLFGVL